MQADQPASESVEQAAVSTSGEQGGGSTQQAAARTYECNFCKRGFTNAQALGGHMNIHRKDKAKLKQASNEAQQERMETPKNSPPIPTYPSPTATHTLHHGIEISPRQLDRNVRSSWPWKFSPEDHLVTTQPRDETHVGKLVQLPLFAETTSRIKDEEVTSRAASAITEMGLPPDQGSSVPEIDLELRLGHEFPEPPATPGTRKFF